MVSLRHVRNRIASVKNIQQITRAMKLVASSRLRVAQKQLLDARPYAMKMTEMITKIAQHTKDRQHPLLNGNDSERTARIVLTSDKGMCGGFNIQPLQTAISHTDLTHLSKKVDYMCLGRKGLDFFRRHGLGLYKQWAGFWQDLNWYHADSIAEEIMKEFVQGRWANVTIIYNQFKSALIQETVKKELLPLPEQPARSEQHVTEFEFEPKMEDVFQHLLPRYIKIALWHALLESKAAEQAARMQAMDNATTSAGEMIDDMTLQLNRARQAVITNEISELVGSAEAING